MRLNSLLAAITALTMGAAVHAAPIWSDNFDADPVGLNSVPAGWTVTSGTVDIIGAGSSFDLLPGNGAYIDLDGSTFDAGLLSYAIDLVAGQQYFATFDLAGSQRGTTETGTVSFGSASLSYDIASSVGFSTYTLNFTPTTSGSYTLSFQNATGDNIGALLDNVAVTAAVPEPGTYVLLAAGLLAIGFASRRRRKED